MSSFIFQTHFGDFYCDGEKKKDGKFHAVCHQGSDTTEVVRSSLPELKEAVKEVRE